MPALRELLNGYSSENSQAVSDTICAICQENNGAEGAESWKPPSAASLSGSRLALDLLCDILFERKGGQTSYLNLAAELLKWGFHDCSPVPGFWKLPPTLRERLLHDWAIPRLRETKDTNEAAFSQLCHAARNGTLMRAMRWRTWRIPCTRRRGGRSTHSSGEAQMGSGCQVAALSGRTRRDRNVSRKTYARFHRPAYDRAIM